MDLPVLPHDMTREILFKLPPDAMINYCITHKEKLALCNDNAFLTNFVYNNYDGLDFNSIEYSGTNWDKFLFIENLINRMKRWNIDDIIGVRPTIRYENEYSTGRTGLRNVDEDYIHYLNDVRVENYIFDKFFSIQSPNLTALNY